MTTIEIYVAAIDAYWRKPIRGRDYEFWLRVYENNLMVAENAARTTAVTAVVE